jgi:hypothetical protein
MKKSLSILILITIFISFASPIFATTDTSVSDVVGSTADMTTLNTQQTNTQPENGIKLEMPSQTDNPSTIITFTNPSTNNATVQLEIDSKGFVDITSPYTFSALSIGKHTLEFKYQDENGSTQLYDTYIIIIPRAPILSTPVIGADSVIISGTGLANSEIIVLLSSGSTVLTKTAVIDGDGKWSIIFPKTDLNKDIFSLNAYTRRYGYASNLSETTKFTLDNQSSSLTTSNVDFDIRNLTIDSVKNWVLDNQNYLIVAGASLLFGIMLGVLFVSQKKKEIEKVKVQKVEKEFTKIEPKDKGVTLREKLMGVTKASDEGNKEEKKEEVEEVKEEKNTEKIMSKIDFLKDFKNFDPDNQKGEEKQSTVEVSLTSKK